MVYIDSRYRLDRPLVAMIPELSSNAYRVVFSLGRATADDSFASWPAVAPIFHPGELGGINQPPSLAGYC